MTGLGFETIQFASKFGNEGPDAFRLIAAAKAAGFEWIAFDRHTLADQAATPGGLAALAAECDRVELPCRVIQSLRVTDDEDETRAGFARLVAQVTALAPDAVPLIVLTEPTPAVRSLIGELVERLGAVAPGIRFGLEFGPIFPVPDLRAAREVLQTLGDERIGLTVDTWHVFNGRTSWADLRTLTPAEIALVQINDHGPLDGQSLDVAKNHRRLPGAGSFALPQFRTWLREVGYCGLLSVEVISAELRTVGAEQFASMAFNAAQQFVRGT